jgi:hypothetical protein
VPGEVSAAAQAANIVAKSPKASVDCFMESIAILDRAGAEPGGVGARFYPRR